MLIAGTKYGVIFRMQKTARTRDLKKVLRLTLDERRSRNTHYSLRSFAKSLSISSAALSEIMNGKRPITEKMKFRLGEV
jgi:transcriptional regulator with XRE-family HTH domain